MARSSFFCDGLITTGPVITYRRRADENFWLLFSLSDCSNQSLGGFNAAESDFLLLQIAPSFRRNGLACQVYNTVHTLNRLFPSTGCARIPGNPLLLSQM